MGGWPGSPCAHSRGTDSRTKRQRRARRTKCIPIGCITDMAKVMISMPEDLLERLDREAERRGTSRSALLRAAAWREIGGSDPRRLDAALARGRAALAEAPPFESGNAVRA